MTELKVTTDIVAAATELLAAYKTALDSSKASGNLVDSANVTVDYDGRYFNIYFEIQDYWKYVENGTQPHFPPVSAIEEWIRVKQLVPQAINGRVPSTKGLAYMIARKISREGTQGNQALNSVLDSSDAIIDKMVEFITDQMEKEIDKDVEQSL